MLHWLNNDQLHFLLCCCFHSISHDCVLFASYEWILMRWTSFYRHCKMTDELVGGGGSNHRKLDQHWFFLWVSVIKMSIRLNHHLFLVSVCETCTLDEKQGYTLDRSPVHHTHFLLTHSHLQGTKLVKTERKHPEETPQRCKSRISLLEIKRQKTTGTSLANTSFTFVVLLPSITLHPFWTWL